MNHTFALLCNKIARPPLKLCPLLRSGKKHENNDTSNDEMRQHSFHSNILEKEWRILVHQGGYFDNIEMYYGIVFDMNGDTTSLCSNDKGDSLFLWNIEGINE